MATTLSDFSAAASFGLLRPAQCRSFRPSSSPSISHHHSSIARSSSLHFSNRNRNEIEKGEETSYPSTVASTIVNNEESRLTEQLRHSIESGNYNRSVTLVESMCAKGFQINKYLCFLLLKALASAPDPDKAARLVELLEAEGRQDKHVYNMFIGCLCKAGRLIAAFEALGRMRSHGFHPKSSPNGSIVKGLCDHKMLEAALATLEHFRTEYRCAPNWVTYGNLIECAIVTRGVEEVPTLLDEMLQDGLRPGNDKMEAMYSMVIHNLCKLRKASYILT